MNWVFHESISKRSDKSEGEVLLSDFVDIFEKYFFKILAKAGHLKQALLVKFKL